jgi:hypothetical protein
VLAGSEISIDLSDTITNVISGASGMLVILDDGLAGQVSGKVELASLLPSGVDFSGTFGVAINDTDRSVTEEITIGDETLVLDLPRGPYVRVSGTGVELNVLGQTLSGNFAFEQTTSTDGAGEGRPVTLIAASDVTLRLGDGTTDFVTITDGWGSFVVLDIADSSGKGLAGALSGTVSLNIPGVDFEGTLGLEINNTDTAIDETFKIGNEETELLLDAGNYVRVAGTDVSLEILGQSLSGNFFFEQSSTPDGDRVVRLGASNVEIFLGDDKGTDDGRVDDAGLLVTGQEAKFLITEDGLAVRWRRVWIC